MRTTFIFDTILFRVRDEYYTRTLTYDLWKNRYFANFGKINVVTRVKEVSQDFIDSNLMLQRVDGPNVTVNPVENYVEMTDAFLKRRSILLFLKNEILISDFVIIRTPGVLSSLAQKICVNEGIPFLNEVVADAWSGYFYHSNILGKVIAPIMESITKKVCRESPNILYVTESFLQKKYPSLTDYQIGVSDVIVPKSDTQILEKRIKRINELFELSMSTRKFIVGIVGNYDLKTKGQALAIEALSDMNNSFILELVGAGNKEYLQKKVQRFSMEKSVSFVGTKKAGKDMFEWMDSIDILLMPSYQEGLPRVMVEAMSRALPIIGSNVGGIPELLDHKYLFKKGNASQLTNILNFLVTNEDSFKEAALKNFIKSNEFISDNLDNKRKKFYKDVISRYEEKKDDKGKNAR